MKTASLIIKQAQPDQAELARVQRANAEAKEAYEKAVKENTAKNAAPKLK